MEIEKMSFARKLCQTCDSHSLNGDLPKEVRKTLKANIMTQERKV